MNILKQIHFCTGVEPGGCSICGISAVCMLSGRRLCTLLALHASALSYSWDVGGACALSCCRFLTPSGVVWRMVTARSRRGRFLPEGA